ncbi:MAG: hypothetical protein IPM29_03045 [Planctomycetes bacterium]|nr:hypothetical protein [Planctomycetota bacterium]
MGSGASNDSGVPLAARQETSSSFLRAEVRSNGRPITEESTIAQYRPDDQATTGAATFLLRLVVVPSVISALTTVFCSWALGRQREFGSGGDSPGAPWVALADRARAARTRRGEQRLEDFTP